MATDTNNQVVKTEKRPTDAGATDLNATDTNAEALEIEARATDLNATDTNAEAAETKTRATDTNAEALEIEARATDLNATDTNNQVVETEKRPTDAGATDLNATDTNAEAVETEARATDLNATDTNAEAVETEQRATNRNREPAESEIRPNLIWDNEAPGLCVRCYGDGAKSFIFVYRRDDRQRFVRIGRTPTWSLEGARRWAKELRSAVDRGDDPESYNRERQKIQPVESFIQFIAEHLQTAP
jgi:hypothetical protein